MSTLKVIPYLAASLAGWIGWTLGRKGGPFAAYLLAVIGVAAGLYYGRRLVKRVQGEI
jgi:uncharacterized membrane protein YfcA